MHPPHDGQPPVTPQHASPSIGADEPPHPASQSSRSDWPSWPVSPDEPQPSATAAAQPTPADHHPQPHTHILSPRHRTLSGTFSKTGPSTSPPSALPPSLLPSVTFPEPAHSAPIVKMDSSKAGQAPHRSSSGYFPAAQSAEDVPMLGHPARHSVSDQSRPGSLDLERATGGADVHLVPPHSASLAAEGSTTADQNQGLTFLPFDVIDPDYQPHHRRTTTATSVSNSGATRNPFSYIARRFGNQGPSRKGGRDPYGGILTISDGIMPDGSEHPLRGRSGSTRDEPLRRYSTTAINIPDARPIGPTTVRDAGDIIQSQSQSQLPHHQHYPDAPRHRKSSRSNRQYPRPPRYRESPSLHPFEMAVENVGLLHDPIFGLPTIDANPEATARMLDISPMRVDGLRRRNHGGGPSGPRNGTSGMGDGNSSSSSSSSSESETEAERRSTIYPSAVDNYPLGRPVTDQQRDSGEEGRDTSGQPRPIERHHHHPLPSALNPLAPIMRNNEAAQMKSWWRRELFLLMEDPSSGTWAFAINLFVCFMIIASSIITIVETIPSLLVSNPNLWFNLESVIVGIFTAEFILRLIAHTDNRRQLARHLFSFLTIVDLVAIIPYYIELGVDRDRTYEFRFTIVRVFRLFRVFSVFKYSSLLQLSVEVMLIAMRRSMDALAALLFFMILTIVIFATILYFIERGEYDPEKQYFVNKLGDPSSFDSIPACLWYVSVALTTTGFGDVTPKTVWGKIMSFPLIMIGVLLIALPSIIVGREFTVVWQAMKLRRRKEFQTIQQMQRDARRKEKQRRRQERRERQQQLEHPPDDPNINNEKNLKGYVEHNQEPGSSKTLSVMNGSNSSKPDMVHPEDAQVINMHDYPAAPHTAPLDSTITSAKFPFPPAATDMAKTTSASVNDLMMNTTKDTATTKVVRPEVESPLSEPELKPGHHLSRLWGSKHHKHGYGQEAGGSDSHKHGKHAMGKSQSDHSDEAYSLYRSATKDLRKYSPDQAFMVMAHGFGLGKYKPKGRRATKRTSGGRPGPSGSNSKLPGGAGQTQRHSHHAGLSHHRPKPSHPGAVAHAATDPSIIRGKGKVVQALATKIVPGSGHRSKREVKHGRNHTSGHYVVSDGDKRKDDDSDDDDDDSDHDDDDDSDSNDILGADMDVRPLDLDNDSVITTDQDSDSGSDEVSINSDMAYTRCIDDNTLSMLTELPKTITELKTMFQLMQENQLAIQKSILLMSQRIEGIEGDGNLSPLRSHPVSATHSAESRTSTQSNAGGSTGKIKKSPGVKATEGSKNGGGGPPLAATATPGRPRPPSNATATKVVPERYPGDLASLVPLNPVEASHLIKRGDTIAASSHTKHAAVAGSGGAAHATLGLGLGLGQGQGQGQVPGQRRPPVDPVLEAGSMSMEPLQQQQPISFRSPKSTGGSISVSSSPHLRAQPHSLAHRSPASAKRPTALNLPSIPPFRPRNSPSVTTAGGGGMVPSSSSGIGSSSGGNTHFMSSPKPPQPPAALLGQFPGISRQRSISTAIVKKDKEPALDRDEPKGTNQ